MPSPGSDPSTVKKGLNVYIAGVGIQETFILLFLALGVKFQKEMGAVEKERRAAMGRRGWMGALVALYAVLVLITVSYSPCHLVMIWDRSASSTA
jgi:hypothetical protein